MTLAVQQQCPLCLGSNACVNAEGGSVTCWCFKEYISDSFLKSLQRSQKGSAVNASAALKIIGQKIKQGVKSLNRISNANL